MRSILDKRKKRAAMELSMTTIIVVVQHFIKVFSSANM